MPSLPETILEQGIVDLAHPRLHALADPFDRRFGGQAGIDRLVDPPRPALVVGEHLVGLEHLVMLAGSAEFGTAGHRIDLLAHLAEGGVDAVALGLGVLGDGVLDEDARLVVDGDAPRHAHDEAQALEAGRTVVAGGRFRAGGLVGEPGIGDQLGEHHRDRLQRLDLDIVIGARIGMLDGEDADRPLPPHDGHAGEAVEQLLAGLGPVGEFGVADGFGEVEHGGGPGDRADQPLAQRQLGDVDGALVEADRGVEFEHPVAQQVDGADLALHRLGDDLHHLVELRLRAQPRRHHVVEAGQYLTGRSGRLGGHEDGLAGRRRASNGRVA